MVLDTYRRHCYHAKNILAAGLAVSACGPGVSQRILRNAVQSGLKQERSAAKPGIPAL